MSAVRAPAAASGPPLLVKLGIKPGARVLLVGAPRGYRTTLGPLPSGARVARGLPRYNFIQVFVRSTAGLRAAIRTVRRKLEPDGMLWVSWPNRSSGVATDVDENTVRSCGLAAGLVDVKICAVDAVWSGLKFVIPLKMR